MRTALRPSRLAGRPARPLVAAALAASALWAAACHHTTEEAIDTSDKVPVVTAPATRADIRATVVATGSIKPAPGAELAVTAPQAARIAELPRASGDRVHKGDLLVRFEIPSLEADATSRRSDLARARARLENARAAEVRIQGLFERGVAARKELEDARRELADAEAGVTEASSSQQAAGTLAGREVVRAPFDGVIASRGHNPGDLVDSSSDPILRLVDPARLQVEAAVPLAGVSQISAGAPAHVLAPGGAPPEEARLLTRPAAVDPATGAALVRLAFLRPTHLPVGTPVQAEILGDEHQNALVVPATAVVQEGAESFVYTVDAKGIAHRKPVKTGVSDAEHAEILDGLAAGDKVIVHGQNGLPDGAAVSQAEAAAQGEPAGEQGGAAGEGKPAPGGAGEAP